MPDKNKDPVALVEQANAAIADINTTVNALDKELRAAVNATGDDVKAAAKVSSELAEKVTGLSSQLLDIEQNMGEFVMQGKAPVESLGHMVIQSEGFKDFAAGNSQKMSFQANTITGQDGSPPANSDTIVGADRLSGIIPGAFRKLMVADILPNQPTTSNAVEYTRELLATNNAAETAEGVAMAQSVLTFELESATVKTIGTFLKTSVQVVEDAPALESYINTRLRHFVNQRVDSQIISGDGTGQNLSGILVSGNHTAFGATTGENALDTLNRSIEAAALADYPPTAIILNPADWYAIERLKVNAGTDDRYIIGNPNGVMNPALWGLPVVVTNSMTAGSFITAAFDIAYGLWNRAETTVEMYIQDEDNAQKNLLTIAAKNRKALAVYRPASSQSGALTA